MNNQFALFYIKEDQLYPVAMSQDEFEMLQVVIPMVFQGNKVTVIDKPQGTVDFLKPKGGTSNETYFQNFTYSIRHDSSNRIVHV